MKERLICTLRDVEALLRECGLDDRADWIALRRDTLESYPSVAAEFGEALKDIESVLVGMGSFADAPMYPRPGSSLTRQEALEKQWDLTESLGNTIRAMSGRK